MNKTLVALACLALAVPVAPRAASHAGSRVIVSTTLNSTLQFFDASTLRQTQPPLPVRGGGPVRMVVTSDHLGPVLYTANHGAAGGSVGIYDLSGDLVLEEPLSPVPARAGAVAIDAAGVNVGASGIQTVFVTNTTFALGGCGMPTGSVTAYARYSVVGGVAEVSRTLVEAGTVELSGPIPYGVAIAPSAGRAFASTNCGDALDTIELSGPAPIPPPYRVAKTGSRPTGDAPDAVLWDDLRGRAYVTNIGGDSVSVFDADSPAALTTVPLPGAGPIDATLGTSSSGRDWLITSNGEDDSIGVIDRARIEQCVLAAAASCPDAQVGRITTAVPGGEPEGVAFDPATNRVFVVNKGIMEPSLSVIQLTEQPDGSVTGADIQRIPLQALGEGTPLPAIIAFDVVVQPRAV